MSRLFERHRTSTPSPVLLLLKPTNMSAAATGVATATTVPVGFHRIGGGQVGINIKNRNRRFHVFFVTFVRSGPCWLQPHRHRGGGHTFNALCCVTYGHTAPRAWDW